MVYPFEKPKREMHVCNGTLPVIVSMSGLLGIACAMSEEEQDTLGFTSADLAVTHVGNNGTPSSAYPLGLCEGETAMMTASVKAD